jgi:hypothetical protein
VDAEIMEHAAHLLARAPTRCMRADALHRRVQADLRREVPYRRFVDALRRSEDRFAMLPCPLGVAEQPGWVAEETSVYAAALSAAGASGAPTVALASPRHPPTAAPPTNRAAPSRKAFSPSSTPPWRTSCRRPARTPCSGPPWAAHSQVSRRCGFRPVRKRGAAARSTTAPRSPPPPPRSRWRQRPPAAPPPPPRGCRRGSPSRRG